MGCGALCGCNILKLHELTTALEKVQQRLIDVGARISRAPNCAFSEKHVEDLEKNIDTLLSKLSDLTCFILPGGNRAAVSLHLCRTVCRRAERSLLRLSDFTTSNKSNPDAIIRRYINRLSDYFYAAAR